LTTSNLDNRKPIRLLSDYYIFVCLGITVVIKKDYQANVFLEIDKDGIWVNNQLITDWKNYIGSFTTKEYAENSNVEKLSIIVKYFKDGESGYFVNQIFFNGNEDKSEQEVIDAARCFFNNHILQLNKPTERFQ